MSRKVFDPSIQCDGKVKYFSRKQARIGRNKINPQREGHLAIYKCPHCEFFHIGHWLGRSSEE